MTEIIRKYPKYKNSVRLPDRYTDKDFEKMNNMINDKELLDKYEKWKNGINYNTKRKISINGLVHKKIDCFYIIISGFGNIYIDDMKKIIKEINKEDYLNETIKIERENTLENKKIDDYNDNIKKLINDINNLENWKDFIEFEGKCYGLVEKVRNKIHIEDDCKGEIIFIEKDYKYKCIDKPFCYTPDKKYEYDISKCNKCNYIHIELISVK